MERDTPYTFTVLAVEKGYILHVYSAGGGKGIHPTRLQCWRWKRDTSYTYTVLAVENGYTIHIHIALRWKGIQHHGHTVGCGNEYTITSTLLVVETYITYAGLPKTVSPASAFPLGITKLEMFYFVPSQYV